MIKSQGNKLKRVPVRRCIVTGLVIPKKQLIRIVLNKNKEIFIDHSSKADGKGFYITPNLGVLQKAKKTKILEKITKIKIENTVYEEIENEIKKYWI